jgi:hypothetical protein
MRFQSHFSILPGFIQSFFVVCYRILSNGKRATEASHGSVLRLLNGEEKAMALIEPWNDSICLF